MQAHRQDRHRSEPPPRGLPTRTLLTLGVVLVLGGLSWTLTEDTPEPPPPAVAQPAPPVRSLAEARTAELAEVPAIPRVESAEPPAAEPTSATVTAAAPPDTPSAPAAAPAEDSETVLDPGPAPAPPDPDTAVRNLLGPVAGSGLPASLLLNSNLIDRAVAALDMARRGLTPERILNLRSPAGAFATESANGLTWIAPTSYQRHDGLITELLDVPVERLAAAFHTFRPELEAAFGALGYPPASVDRALIAALDEVIDTPVVRERLSVRRQEAVWVYEREDLEARSRLQKLLLRQGPDNVARIREQAARLREALLTGGG